MFLDSQRKQCQFPLKDYFLRWCFVLPKRSRTKTQSLYYAKKNEHRVLSVPLKSPGLAVLSAISYDLGVTFRISCETMNKKRYVTFLNQKLLSFIGNDNQHWYQDDGASPHFSIPARQWLDQHFPQQWIGRRWPTEWPPRSLDLTILDFWLWS